MLRLRFQICAFLIAGIFCYAVVVSAQVETPVNGQAIFSTNCAACHGSDGRGGERAPSIASRREVVTKGDAELIRSIQNGVSGTAMPPFGYMGMKKIEAVVKYLRGLQGLGSSEKVPGDSRLGEQIFFGKAACSNCHAVHGRGGFLGSDLSSYGAGRSVENIREAILDPYRNLDRKSQTVIVVTASKKEYQGVICNEDNFSLTLQSEDGVFHAFSRDQVASVQKSGRSFMPDDYGQKLTNKEVDDLVSYLLQTGSLKQVQTSQKNSNDEE